MGRLDGRVALITGASSGIGAGLAVRFAKEGAKVGVNYLAVVPNAQAAAEQVVTNCGGAANAVAIPGDVSKRGDVEAMVASLVATFGRIDIAVNNAGIEKKKAFVDVTDDEWDAVIAVNLKGPFLVTQTAVRQMLKQTKLDNAESIGKIVNISSTHEDIPFPNYTSYCASKGAMRMFTKNLGVDLAPLKININSVAPGAIATPINQATLANAQSNADTIAEIPWGRWGTPDDVAGVAVFLASEDANYVTGSTYYVDGALSIQVTKY